MGKVGARSALIAVVDDDHAICQSISSLVRSVGYRCVTFGSAESFLESGRLGNPDCLLLDVRMPGMDGLGLQLALSEMNCEIPIIYVSAANEGGLRERAYRQGAVAFLAKPFVDDDLLNAIRAALSGSASIGRDALA
jgi:FixJ family two-component response regulator